MLIEYRATKHRRDVPESIGERLVASRIAVKVEAEAPKKRKYRRRDMRAED